MARDRIKELRRVPASELRANPKNWRKHPETQRKAMQTILDRVGYADALLAREDDDGTLLLIDGHLRTDISGEEEVPVLILDVDEQEADLLLASFDPIGNMADADEYSLDQLIQSLRWDESEAVVELLETIGGSFDLDYESGFGDLDFEGGDVDEGDFALVQYIIQVPKHRASEALEKAVEYVANEYGANFKVHGVKG